MATQLTLADVQGLMDAHERRTAERHTEVRQWLKSLAKQSNAIEDRQTAIEMELAERRPIFNGMKGAAAILLTSLLAGYIGSLFSVS